MSFVVIIVGWLLRSVPFKVRQQLVVHILDSVQALPLSAIIDANEQGELTIRNRSLDIETVRALHAHARSALENKALNLIREQVKYEAAIGAVTKAVTGDDLTFYRAALWWGQREEHFLSLLAGREEPDL